MKSLEAYLHADFPEHRAITTSRGTAALYLALRVIADQSGEGEVVVPSTVCLSVPVTVALAGFQPRFCDVELETFGMSERMLAPHLNRQTRAVIAVHLFGKALPIEAIQRMCGEKSIPLIEDLAQAIGGERAGRRLGSWGDFTILSFNDKKILPGRGGALLVRGSEQRERAEALDTTLAPPLAPDAHQELASAFHHLDVGLRELLRAGDLTDFFPIPIDWIEKFRPLLAARGRAEESARTALAYAKLAEERAARHARYLKLTAALTGRLAPVPFAASEMCWRVPLLVADHAEQLEAVRHLRAAEVLVSNHYFTCSPFFGRELFPNARRIALCAINVGVERDLTPAQQALLQEWSQAKQ